MLTCPHCQKSIRPLSAAIMGPTPPGGARTCPHCQAQFAITADKKLAALTAVAAAVVGFFVLRPIPYVGAGLWGAVTVAATFLVAARLQKVST